MAEHAIVVLCAGNALLDGAAQNADNLCHAGDDLRLGQVPAGHFVFRGQFPERGVASRVVAQHFFAGREWHPRVFARRDRQYWPEPLHLAQR